MAKDDTVIKVCNIGKRYSISGLNQRYELLIENLPRFFINLFKGISKMQTVWALKDVSLDVKRGEILGIIGRNGVGKSTLLKIISRIVQPTEGYIEIQGRVGSILEIGTGFHEELTGRENIFLNGTILGMKKREIEHKFDDIVKFAGVERFLDTSIKYYSDGMRLRLAFSVAAHLDSEILLLDEVLAVGDYGFQKRCLNKVERLAKSGRTILLVSHNLEVVQNFCTRAVLLEDGKVIDSGQTEKVVSKYLDSIEELIKVALKSRLDRQGNGKLKFTNIRFLSGQKEVKQLCSGDDITIEISYEAREEFDPQNIVFYLTLKSKLGVGLSSCQSNLCDVQISKIRKQGKLFCRLLSLPLSPGNYFGNLSCMEDVEMIDWVIDAFSFEVIPGRFYPNGMIPLQLPILLKQEWEHREG